MQKILRVSRSKLHTLKTNFIVSTATSPLNNDNGEGFLDVAFKVLIVVLVGGVVLGILTTAMPGLFNSLIDRVSSELIAS